MTDDENLARAKQWARSFLDPAMIPGRVSYEYAVESAARALMAAVRAKGRRDSILELGGVDTADMTIGDLRESIFARASDVPGSPRTEQIEAAENLAWARRWAEDAKRRCLHGSDEYRLCVGCATSAIATAKVAGYWAVQDLLKDAIGPEEMDATMFEINRLKGRVVEARRLLLEAYNGPHDMAMGWTNDARGWMRGSP